MKLKPPAIIVINRNRQEATACVLTRLQQFTPAAGDVYLVEVGCATTELVPPEVRELAVVKEAYRVDEDVGWIAGCQTALAHVLKGTYTHVWFINGVTDVSPTLARMYRSIKTSGRNVGMVRWGEALEHWWVKTRICREIGFVDQRYHGEFEAVDWEWRVRLAGYDCRSIGQSLKRHPTPLTAYFSGRNPGLFIHLRLGNRWWNRAGWEAFRYWWRNWREMVLGGGAEIRRMFWAGTRDGWKLLRTPIVHENRKVG